MINVVGADRTQPHSIEAEKATLCAVLVKATLWPVLSSALSIDDFFRDAHRLIFAAYGRLADASTPLDYVTLKEELRRVGELDTAGGPAYLASLTDGLPAMRPENLEHYARIVREKARLRSAIACASDLLARAYEAEAPAATIVDGAMNRLATVVDASDRRVVSAAGGIRAYASAINTGTYGPTIKTGYVDVDNLIGGFRRSDLVIVAARPSVGKSALALGMAEAMALAGLVVLMFPIEMNIEGVSSRLVAGRARVESAAIERGLASAGEYARWADASGAFEGLPLRFQGSATTLAEIAAWRRRAQQEEGLGAVIVDYLQLLVSDDPRVKTETAIASISKGLKRLAKELNVPVIALSQLNRASESRTDKRPHLSDLRSSGALEQDCDLAILLHRASMHGRTPENDVIAEVIVAKHRGGPTGCVRLAFI